MSTTNGIYTYNFIIVHVCENLQNVFLQGRNTCQRKGGQIFQVVWGRIPGSPEKRMGACMALPLLE